MATGRSGSVVKHRHEGLHRVGFEKERGINSISCLRDLTHIVIEFPQAEHPIRHRHQLEIFRALAQAGISISLFKLHKQALSFIIHRQDTSCARSVLEGQGFPFQVVEPMALVVVYAPNMRELTGVMANIVEALLNTGVSIVQTGDSYNSVMCLIRQEDSRQAIQALKEKFGVEEVQD